MCTKFLGDGLCCGYDCYEEQPMAPIEADLDSWEEQIEEGIRVLAGCGPECGCDYPHGHDFEPPFETCTCVIGCSHYPTYDQEFADIGEDLLDGE